MGRGLTNGAEHDNFDEIDESALNWENGLSRRDQM